MLRKYTAKKASARKDRDAMRYVSTRGGEREGVSSAYAIKAGLALDGGLYMPSTIPALSKKDIEELTELTYAERSAKILSLYLTDYSYDELLEDARLAYEGGKFDGYPAPISTVDDGALSRIHMLELWHGPTCAFKDMALSIMPRLFVRAMRKCGEKREAMILVATSGDTGKAALEGYRDVDGTRVMVFYPTDGVSRVQKLQMQTQEGSNVRVVGIRGNFDDAQSGVKAIFSNPKINDELSSRDVFLSSANSINWGRLVPQVVYYVSAYCDLLKKGLIDNGESLDVTVPTGNFGNIFACYLAKKMGLPIGRLICASNKNDVLTDFLRNGVYDKNREFHTTMSPSMDILISSNLERLLYLTLGTEKTASYMRMLREQGCYTLSGEDLELIKRDFIGYSADEEETARVIKWAYENKNCLIDTHTAVALSATLGYRSENKAERNILTVSTASPYKFARSVYLSLTGGQCVDDLNALDMLEALTTQEIPHPLDGIGERAILHDGCISVCDMESAVMEFASGN